MCGYDTRNTYHITYQVFFLVRVSTSHALSGAVGFTGLVVYYCLLFLYPTSSHPTVGVALFEPKVSGRLGSLREEPAVFRMKNLLVYIRTRYLVFV